ncbi:hypothetical protein R6Q57_007092 [Mikania cordata]
MPMDVGHMDVGQINNVEFSFELGRQECSSKSLDRDSYNSGDWLNRIDFSYNSNKWGVGLPPKGKNEKNRPLYSSVLFRLRTANAIQMSTDNSVKNSTYDPLMGCFSIPSRTSSVFVELCNIQE